MDDKSFPVFPPQSKRYSKNITMTFQDCVRVYRNSPGAIQLQIRTKNQFVTASLPFETARLIAAELLKQSGVDAMGAVQP